MKWIGSPVAEIWPFAYLGDMEPPILGEGGRKGQRWPLRYICNNSAAICDRMFPTLKSTKGGSLWAQISGTLMFNWVCRERTSQAN